jgi:DNA-binding transcriptional regulator YhcF (GntR family)
LKTYNSVSHGTNQELFYNTFLNLQRHSTSYNSFFTPFLGKLISCSLTMSKVMPSNEWLAKQVGATSRRTAQRHLKELVALGWVTIKRRRFGSNREQTNVYTLNPSLLAREFLEQIAPHYHEIKLYLLRTAREHALKSLSKFTKTIQVVKTVVAGLFQNPVTRFNSLYSSNIFKTKKQVNTRAHARVQPANISNRIQEKEMENPITKKQRLEEALNRPLVKKLARIKRLDLPLAGCILAASYPDKVLERVLKLAEIRKISKPMAWFSSMCARMAFELNLLRDSKLMYELQEHYNIDDKAHFMTIKTAQILKKPYATIDKPTHIVNASISDSPIAIAKSQIGNEQKKKEDAEKVRRMMDAFVNSMKGWG